MNPLHATIKDKTQPSTGSELALRTIAMPVFANAHGDIFGGWLLSQMDLAGSAVAIRRANGRVVTVAVTQSQLSAPRLCRRRGELLRQSR